MEDIKKVAEDFLTTEQGKKIAAKRGDLEKLAASADGRKMQELFSTASAKKAAESGDMKTLAGMLSDALKTEEGARLAKTLQNLIK